MKTYVVGGAVRDKLLGLPVADRDFVVVGATPEDMARRGFRPVGKDFPVFLHPETHEEYALARTERKSGRGYKGFTVYTAPALPLGARERVLLVRPGVQEHREVLADRAEARGDHVLGRRADHHVVAVLDRQPEQLVAHRAADRVGFQARRAFAG